MAHSWEVVCITIDEDSPHDDCRTIDEIGYKAPTLTIQGVDNTASKITSDLSGYHMMHDGSKLPLEAAKDDTLLYVRTRDEDSPDDPLLGLPRKSQYEERERYEHL